MCVEVGALHSRSLISTVVLLGSYITSIVGRSRQMAAARCVVDPFNARARIKKNQNRMLGRKHHADNITSWAPTWSITREAARKTGVDNSCMSWVLSTFSHHTFASSRACPYVFFM